MRLPALLLLATLSGCAGVQDVVVAVPPPAAPAAAPSPRPATVALAPFREPGGIGALPGRVGERKTIGNLSMGAVTVAPPPGELLRQAIAAELQAAGHRLGPGGPALEGEVRRFTLHTDVTALYWDVIGEAALDLALRGPGGAAAPVRLAAECRERTYAWPSAEVMARVLAACVADLAGQFRRHPEIRRGLEGG